MKKRSSPRKKNPPPAEAGRLTRRLFLAGGALLAGIASAGWFLMKRPWGDALPAAAGDLPRRGEKRPVLSPLNYRDSVRRAYQAARETPSLFDKLFCYCYCDRSFGHKTLLSCYATTHAAG